MVLSGFHNHGDYEGDGAAGETEAAVRTKHIVRMGIFYVINTWCSATDLTFLLLCKYAHYLKPSAQCDHQKSEQLSQRYSVHRKRWGFMYWTSTTWASLP